MRRVHLGLDLGTSSVKALLLDHDGRTIATARASYQVDAPEPGWAETDPASWWAALRVAVGDVLAATDVVPASVGLAGQMHGVVLVADDGEHLRPAMLWPDVRASDELGAYRSLPASTASRLANPLAPGMAGPLLRWISAHEREVAVATRWALQPKDWLRFRLTGRIATEPSDASGTLLYDVAGDRWDVEVARALRLAPAILPPLTTSTSVVGPLLNDVADELGLPPGLPVVAGAADTPAAAVGTGLVRPGVIQLTVGTGGQIVTPLREPVAAPERGVHLYRAATEHGWYAMAATLNGGLALDHVRRVFDVSWEDLYATAATPVREDDPVFAPHLAGERTPHLDPTMRGGWAGVGLQHDRAALLRAALEGVAFALRDALEVLPVARDLPIVLAGGGTQHGAWRQLLATVLGRPLAASEVTDASARGAALLAAIGTGDASWADVRDRLAPRREEITAPHPTTATVHAARFDRYQRTVAALREVAALGDVQDGGEGSRSAS